MDSFPLPGNREIAVNIAFIVFYPEVWIIRPCCACCCETDTEFCMAWMCQGIPEDHSQFENHRNENNPQNLEISIMIKQLRFW